MTGSILAAAGGAAPDASPAPLWAWVVFGVLAATLMIIDLAILHRGGREPSLRESAVISAIWIAVGLGFTAVVWIAIDASHAGQYVAGYLIEKSLSVDNVFVWAAVFTATKIPRSHQHRVLTWGILGAAIMRAIFVVAGVALLERFTATLYVFGAILLFGAYRIWKHRTDEHISEEAPAGAGWLRDHLPMTDKLHGRHFFVRENGKLLATPLFLALILVELTDVIFAVDSVPAVLAVSQSIFIVYSSNLFAILGLRSLYVVLIGAADRLVYLNQGLAVILAFVGVKLIIAEQYHLPTWLSLAVICGVLTVTVVASLRAGRRPAAAAPAATPEHRSAPAGAEGSSTER